MIQKVYLEFISTQEVFEHFWVSISTVYLWIKGGWIEVETILSAQHKAQRRVHHYYIPRSALATSEQETRTMFSELQKYVPREKARQRRKAEKNKYQLALPGLEVAS